MRGLVAVQCGNGHPFIGADRILFAREACVQQQAQIELADCQSLFGGARVPLGGFGKVLSHTNAALEHSGKACLCHGVAQFGSLAHQFGRSDVVRRHAAPFVHHVGQVQHGHSGALVGGSLIVLRRHLIIASESAAFLQ